MLTALVDVPNLCWRNYHAMRFGGTKRMANFGAFGVLRDVVTAGRALGTDRFCFAFDEGVPHRRLLYPAYKAKSQARDPATREAVSVQLRLLRDELLPALGYDEVWTLPGYEADDLIAMATLRHPTHGPYAIVSNDTDLYQLLRDNPGDRTYTVIWNHTTRHTVTEGWLRDVHPLGLTPSEWMMMKALAGCCSDNVAGVGGVGEITAAKYLKGEITSGRAYDKIVSTEGAAIYERNKKLVWLPFFLESAEDMSYMSRRLFHCRRPEPETWDAVMMKMDYHGLLGKCPALAEVA